MLDNIKKILETAILAPSGENSQPWKFKVHNNIVQIYNVPEQDLSLYNWGQRGSYIANGAVLENITIAASAFKYKANIKFFPDPNNSDYIAEVNFSNEDISEDELNKYIPLRSTNRKKYDHVEFSDNQIAELSQSNQKYGQILFTHDKENIKKLANVAAVNEEIMLSNLYLHNFFFTHINWNKEEDDKRKVGFYIESLELPPPAKILFKLFRHWSIMKWLNKFNFNKVVSKQNAAVYSSASAMGIIVAESNEALDYVKSGMIMQRMWLKATKMGISVHPLTGTLFFMLNLIGGESDKFNSHHINLIKESHKIIEDIFKVQDKPIVFMFRIGNGGNPTARSSKFSLDQVLEITT